MFPFQVISNQQLCGADEKLLVIQAVNNTNITFLDISIVLSLFKMSELMKLQISSLVYAHYISTNISHFLVTLKFLMKLLFCPQVQFLGFALIYVPTCPAVKGSSSCYDSYA
jgi:hypothetical protein